MRTPIAPQGWKDQFWELFDEWLKIRDMCFVSKSNEPKAVEAILKLREKVHEVIEQPWKTKSKRKKKLPLSCDDRMKLVDEIRPYVDLDNSELGEYCSLLCQASRSALMSEEFEAALDQELMDELEAYKEQSEIVEKEEVYTRKYKELEWL